MNYVLYRPFLVFVENGAWTGWGTADVRAMLLKTETTTPDNAAHEFVSHISADESTATNYARTASAISGFSITNDATNNRIVVTHNAIDWGTINAVGQPLKGLIYFIQGASDAARKLIMGIPLPNLEPTGNGFITQPGANGIYVVKRAA